MNADVYVYTAPLLYQNNLLEEPALTETTFIKKINDNNGEVYIVGGWVRDMIAHNIPKDKDYVICKMTEILFCRLFPQAQKVGNAFPVYLMNIDNKLCEIAFARKEKKQGHGYKGFTVNYDADLTIEDDLLRRDTRINSIALKLPERTLIDPFNGVYDIKNKIIRAVSSHFQEDPVRALRAARQAAEFNYIIDELTLQQMQNCAAELLYEPSERIINELSRALAANKPSTFFRYLQKANLLTVTFPEIAALIGQTQPVIYHPEGDSFEHTMLILDKTALQTTDIAARFAALAHDLGKGLTPQSMLPHHYGHEKSGLLVLQKWNKRIILPKRWYNSASFVISEHMRAAHLTKPGKIADLLLSAEKNPLGIDNFSIIIHADNKSLPCYLEDSKLILKLFHEIDIKKCPANLRGRQIGQWLHQQRVNILNTYLQQYNQH